MFEEVGHFVEKVRRVGFGSPDPPTSNRVKCAS